MPSSYIVTGGAGFIGANLCAELLRREPDANITVVDDTSVGSFANIVEACTRAGVGPFQGRFLPYELEEVDMEDLIDVCEPTAFFHLAAITDTTVDDERQMIEENAMTFPPIIQACAAADVPLVYASSAATYGTPPQVDSREPFPLEAAGEPNNVYGFSKWQMENEHRRFAASGADAHIVGLRYFNVFGPGEARKEKMASLAYQLTQQLLDDKRPRLFTAGEQARDQVHVDDIVACTLAGAHADARSGIYNAGSGRATTFNQIADAIMESIGIDREIEYFDMPPDIREFYQDFTCADMSQTEAGLGFTPSVDPIDGIKTYARHLAREHQARLKRRAGAPA